MPPPSIIGRLLAAHQEFIFDATYYELRSIYLFIYLPSSPKGPGECAGRTNADGGGIGRLLTRDVWDVRGVGRQEMEN